MCFPNSCNQPFGMFWFSQHVSPALKRAPLHPSDGICPCCAYLRVFTASLWEPMMEALSPRWLSCGPVSCWTSAQSGLTHLLVCVMSSGTPQRVKQTHPLGMRPIGLASISLAGSSQFSYRGPGVGCLVFTPCVADSQISLVSVGQWKVLRGSGMFGGLDIRVVSSDCGWEISATKDYKLDLNWMKTELSFSAHYLPTQCRVS